MRHVSQILTARKLHIIHRICLTAPSSAAAPPLDYFQVGFPILDPPLIRGSMVLTLDIDFLHENEASFEYGSPVDIGGIRFGFLKPPSPDRFIEKLRCDHAQFLSLVGELAGLQADIAGNLGRHRNTPEAAVVLARHLDREVVDFMLASDARTAWMFEFSLRRGYHLAPHHVLELAFPNTYADLPLFRRLRDVIGRRARPYNPKFGIESVCPADPATTW